MRTLLFALLTCLVLLGCATAPTSQPTPAPTPTPGPLVIIKALESAMNQGDTDAALDLFVDDGLRYHVWVAAAEDKESLRYYLDFYIGIGNPDDTYRDCQSQGDKLTCTWETHDGACYQAFGVDAVNYDIAFTIQDGRILEMVGDIARDQNLTLLGAGMEKKNAWAAENLPEKLEDLQSYVGATERSGREFAALDLEICRAYLEATSE